MSVIGFNLKPIVAAGAVLVAYSLPLHFVAPAYGQSVLPTPDQLQGQKPAEPVPMRRDLPHLYGLLKKADEVDAARLSREIELEWSKSGSPVVDLMLKRGRKALKAKKIRTAIEHFTAVTDHAPGFVEGWHGRAQAFYAVGKLGLAVADLERVLSLDPKHYKAIHGLGRVMERLNRPDKAFFAYGLVLEIYPHHKKAAKAHKRLSRTELGAEL